MDVKISGTSVWCVFFYLKKKYLRGDEKEKTGEKYLEKIECEKREKKKCDRQVRPTSHRVCGSSERVSFDTLYISNEILTKNLYALWN